MPPEDSSIGDGVLTTILPAARFSTMAFSAIGTTTGVTDSEEVTLRPGAAFFKMAIDAAAADCRIRVEAAVVPDAAAAAAALAVDDCVRTERRSVVVAAETAVVAGNAAAAALAAAADLRESAMSRTDFFAPDLVRVPAVAGAVPAGVIVVEGGNEFVLGWEKEQLQNRNPRILFAHEPVGSSHDLVDHF